MIYIIPNPNTLPLSNPLLEILHTITSLLGNPHLADHNFQNQPPHNLPHENWLCATPLVKNPHYIISILKWLSSIPLALKFSAKAPHQFEKGSARLSKIQSDKI